MRHHLTCFSFLLLGTIHGAVHAADNKAPALHYDHFNPVVLNEFALQKYREGDVSSAVILLERAHLLAPHDARIQRNLNLLNTLRSGKLVDGNTVTVSDGTIATPSSADAQVSGIEQLPEQPLWDGKNRPQ